MLPDFAKPIVAAREKGLRPDALVVVQDGDLGMQRKVPNPVVRIDSERHPADYDWRFLAGLDVEVATLGDAKRSVTLARVIAKARPRYLRLLWPDAGIMCLIMTASQVCIMRENDWVCDQEPWCN